MITGVAGACVLWFGLNRFADYAWERWRHRGTEDVRDLWIFLASVVMGLALMYPAARLLAQRKR